MTLRLFRLLQTLKTGENVIKIHTYRMWLTHKYLYLLGLVLLSTDFNPRCPQIGNCRRLSPTVADSIRNVVATKLDGFVAGVRDVNWCPDPTKLSSNILSMFGFPIFSRQQSQVVAGSIHTADFIESPV